MLSSALLLSPCPGQESHRALLFPDSIKLSSSSQTSSISNIYQITVLKLFLAGSEPPKERNSITSFITLIFL